MLPTTSAKYVNSTTNVNFNVQFSHYYLQANTILMVLACCFISVSAIPLVPSLSLLVLLIEANRQYGLLRKPLHGSVTVYADGRIQWAGSQAKIGVVVFALLEWALLLRIDKHWHVLWRDSVEPQVYRQLILQLKREH
ncbi:hypothetical protein OTK51_18525 [Vibrio scophthalmi]|nr:protein YgfX [Vibrio scophthalmi]MCY9805422.1 hypothetical protein [Vibrio scophthalmi]